MLKIQTNLRHIRSSPGFGLMQAVGHTPLLPLERIGAGLPPAVRLLAKAEWLNPGGSVKDRPAASIIRHALKEGALGTGRVLLDSTSGNMGISYATLCGSLGIPVTLTIPASASSERLKVLRTLGAELHETDPLEGSDGAILIARQMKEEDTDRYFYADQYNNPANWQAHYEGTGPEIWQQAGGSVTHFVAGMGTTGTLMGAGRFLRERNLAVRINAFQPDAPFHGLEGLKHMPSAIQPGIYDPHFADETLQVSSEEAHDMTRRLAREEGLFVGVSSGGAAAIALRVAARLERGVVVTVFPDAGYKYLSETFWGFAP
ncbi:MAG: cysteine synthase family protein [Anaerolineales bacterium]